MTSTNVPTDDPGEMTVGELRAALQDRRADAVTRTEERLQGLQVVTLRKEVAEQMTRLAERLAHNAALLDRNAPRLSTDPDDPLADVQRDLHDLVECVGVAEVLHGRGARRVRGE
jgi:light-regulated signal transduction histidine kinase (bacteriophytochrome)